MLNKRKIIIADNRLETKIKTTNLLKLKEYNDLLESKVKLRIEELERTNMIITDFLSITNLKKMENEPKSLQTVLETLQHLLDTNAIFVDKNILYEIQQCPDVMVNESEIRQMLLNFVQNGFENMMPGGRLKIMLYTEEQDVVLAVKVQGKGIHHGSIVELGTPFLTPKEAGTGWGITVCHNIAEHHNAKIIVENNSTGTVFYIRFPVNSFS